MESSMMTLSCLLIHVREMTLMLLALDPFLFKSFPVFCVVFLVGTENGEGMEKARGL